MSDTRQLIVDAANRLFYEQGFDHTSFTSIATTVGISRGNFYHHFKTKDELLAAVIDARVASTTAMLEQWAAATDDPLERIRHFVRIVITNRDDIERYGCPVGTLTGELAKLDHPSRPHAVAIFTLFRMWLGAQFDLLGQRSQSDDLALHVLAFSQGAATLSNAFGDPDFVEREVERMNNWLDETLGRR